MPDPLVTLAHDLAAFAARLAAEPFTVPCGPGGHRVVTCVTSPPAPSAVGVVACDHDAEAERVLLAVGGRPPTCLALAEAATEATAADLWAALDAAMPAPVATASTRRAPNVRGARAGPAADEERRTLLALLPRDVVRLLLVTRLERDFAGAGIVVRAAVARLGLSLLAERFVVTPTLRTRFRMACEFPRFDTGRRAWTDKELVLLQRLLRTSAHDLRPQLAAVPGDDVARRTVALYLVDLLDDHRVLSKRDVAAALAPVHPNTASLIRLLVAEQLLAPVDGGYRTRPVSGGAPPRSPEGRSRPRPAASARPRASGRRR